MLGLMLHAPVTMSALAQVPETLGNPILIIGVESGADEKTFGRIIDLAITGDQSILVLDPMTKRLMMMDVRGEHLVHVGRLGRGPGEYVYPIAVAAAGDSVYVLDAGALRITQYRRTGTGLELVGVAPVGFAAEDMCMVGRRTYARGYHRGRLLHELSANGTIVRSFGLPFLSDSVLGAEATNSELACHAGDQPAIIVAAANLPTVRAYEPSGALRWSTSLPRFNASVITRLPDGGMQYRAAREGDPSHMTVSLTIVSQVVLVQYGYEFRGMSSTEDIVDVTTAVLGLSDGRLLQTLSNFPRIDHAAGAKAYSHSSTPYPRVLVYRLPGRL
jgi:hypothetical protein